MPIGPVDFGAEFYLLVPDLPYRRSTVSRFSARTFT